MFTFKKAKRGIERNRIVLKKKKKEVMKDSPGQEKWARQ